jgi:hypothetical protein
MSWIVTAFKGSKEYASVSCTDFKERVRHQLLVKAIRLTVKEPALNQNRARVMATVKPAA